MKQTYILTMSWIEPDPGAAATTVVLTDQEATEVRSVIDWLQDGTDDWGITVAQAVLHETKATGGDIQTLKETLEYVATACRYDIGDDIYQNDCRILKNIGIQRS